MSDRVVFDMSMLRVDEQTVLDAVVRYQHFLVEADEGDCAEIRRVPDSYACSDNAARRMVAEYRQQASLNTVARSVGLMRAEKTALSV